MLHPGSHRHGAGTPQNDAAISVEKLALVADRDDQAILSEAMARKRQASGAASIALKVAHNAVHVQRHGG